MKYGDHYIETNGEMFRAYRKGKRTRGFWWWKYTEEEKLYVWGRLATNLWGPKEFDTIEETKNGINNWVNPTPTWKLVD